LGNREGFLVRTAEVSSHPLHQFGSRQQPGGFDHGSFPMDPMRLQGIEPGAFDRQGTTHNPDALALPFDLLVMLSEPLPHCLAAVPRRIIPHQQQGGFAHGGQLGADPGQEGDRHRTHRPASHEAQPHVLLAHSLGSPLLDQQAITGQGFGVRIGGGHGLLDEVQGLLRGRPGMQPGLGQATPPRLIFKPQRPLRVAGCQADQAGPGFFLRAYAGSGLVIQCLARCQLTSKRRKAVRIASRLTRWGVRPWAKLTSAANSNVHRLVGWPKVRGLWCNKAWSRWAPSLPKRSRVVWGREVNVLVSALARRLRGSPDSVAGTVLARTLDAVARSGLRQAELWSYRIENDSLRPVRYGSSSDVQLWNLTDLAVQFLLARVSPQGN